MKNENSTEMTTESPQTENVKRFTYCSILPLITEENNKFSVSITHIEEEDYSHIFTIENKREWNNHHVKYSTLSVRLNKKMTFNTAMNQLILEMDTALKPFLLLDTRDCLLARVRQQFTGFLQQYHPEGAPKLNTILGNATPITSAPINLQYDLIVKGNESDLLLEVYYNSVRSSSELDIFELSVAEIDNVNSTVLNHAEMEVKFIIGNPLQDSRTNIIVAFFSRLLTNSLTLTEGFELPETFDNLETFMEQFKQGKDKLS